ncbi:TonB-dependent receptor [Spongiibacter sp. KMU-158]|uniref:TonB-dependent receptor n=1 Tax=Spongiibacter pelagi TaxID=2760804 RepID=A0A927C2E9_9GAMM|nr:TonB-dependent receptor [Spongiibacter pelagi]MBD2858787.1 TonB-dependent receptor [Spongiibacter pelagi]
MSARIVKKYLLVSSVGLFLALEAAAVFSAELALEEIIVTAQKKSESLQDVPISMSVVTGEKIQQAGIKNIEDLAAYVPNLKMSQTLIGNAIFIRGVGSGVNRGFEQSVGMFIDNIYAGRGNQFRSPFTDVSHIEVLKGPQGSLFGKNTIAGAINITTAKPTQEFFAEVIAAVEPEYGSNDYSVIASGPLTDNMGLRFTGKWSESDGYLHNIVTDEDAPAKQESIARLVWQWVPSDKLDLALKLEKGSFDTEGSHHQLSDISGTFYLNAIPLSQLEDYLDPREDGVLDDKNSERNFAGKDPYSITDNEAVVLTANYDISDSLIFTSITGYSAYEYEQTVDGDTTDIAIIGLELYEDFTQLSQEFRFSGQLSDSIDFVAGVFASQQDMYNFQIIDGDLSTVIPAGTIIDSLFPLAPLKTSGIADFDQQTESLGVFGQVSWLLNQDFQITLGLRQGRETKTVDKSQVVASFGEREPTNDPIKLAMSDFVIGVVPHELQGSTTVDSLSPTLNLQYFVNNDVMTYLRFARGFKSGGFNASDGGGDPAKFEFDDEEAENIELGAKLTLLNGAATVNAAYFNTTFNNRQFATLTPTGTVVGNAASSISEGFEVDFRWRAATFLVLNGSAAYLDSEYESFTDAGCTATQVEQDPGNRACVQDLSGKTTEYAAPWTASLGAVMFLPVSENWVASLGVDVNYTAGYYLSADIDDEDYQSDYAKVNARLALKQPDGNWEFSLLAKNLTDEITKTNGNDVPRFIGAHFAGTAPPRTLTMQVTWNY